jgi:L-histidine Nalpha-methyltransferase
MRTGVSAKFRPDGVAAELSAAGFAMQHWWTGGRFGLSLSAPA